MVGMPWSMPPSRSRTTVIPCSSTYRQSSILGERYRQPASSRQMMFISEAPPFEFLLLGIPEDVERVALVVVQVEPHPLAAPPAGLGLVAQRLDGDLGGRGAEGVLTAPLHGELQRPDRGARGERAVHDPHTTWSLRVPRRAKSARPSWSRSASMTLWELHCTAGSCCRATSTAVRGGCSPAQPA